MKQLFILSLFLITGCQGSKICRPAKNYSVLTYWKYGHIKTHGNLTEKNKHLTGYFGHGRELHYLKKKQLQGVLRYYDTCRTMIKEAHLSFYKRKAIHAYYDSIGVITKKKVTRRKGTKIITWDKWGKRTAVPQQKGGRAY